MVPLLVRTALAATAAVIPLLTQMYQENYPEHERGRLFSRAFMIRIATAAVFSKLAGAALNQNLARFPWLLFFFVDTIIFFFHRVF